MILHEPVTERDREMFNWKLSNNIALGYVESYAAVDEHEEPNIKESQLVEQESKWGKITWSFP